MSELLTPPRPNKFLDVAKLEKYMSDNHPDELDEWEYDVSQLGVDLWDWVANHQHGIFARFTGWFITMEKEQRWNKVLEALSDLHKSFYYKQRLLIDEVYVERLITAYDKWLD